ncbi:MAG: YceD family protein [Gammaproteobacteria bacterium]
MPKEYLPLKVDPYRFADNATRLHGSLPIKNMERLASSLATDDNDVEIDIHFGVDAQGLRFLSGQLKTQLGLQCQRCMETFKYEIISHLMLGIVQTEEEAKELPERYDPLLVTKGDDLLIQDVVEDELIVSLPIVPMHEAKDCKIALPLVAESEAAEKDNPFNVIELLRSKRDKE